jgi:hypothetical protein
MILFILGALTVIAAPINLLGNPPNPPSPEDSTGLVRGRNRGPDSGDG